MRDLVGGEAAASLPAERVDEQAAAHADAPVDPPHCQLDARRLEGLAPGQDVLVDAVHQRAVQVEHEGGAQDRWCRRVGSGGTEATDNAAVARNAWGATPCRAMNARVNELRLE
jgi:hypothetical protein